MLKSTDCKPKLRKNNPLLDGKNNEIKSQGQGVSKKKP